MRTQEVTLHSTKSPGWGGDIRVVKDLNLHTIALESKKTPVGIGNVILQNQIYPPEEHHFAPCTPPPVAI